MGKVISKYRGYTPQDLKSRAEIPNQDEITVNTNDISCVNITTTKIRNTIGGSSNILSQLCSHTSINKWSGFSPYLRGVSGNGMDRIMTHSLPSSNFRESDFAGYNHGAVTPEWVNRTLILYEVQGATTIVIAAQATIGELKFNDIVGYTDTVGLAFCLYEFSGGSYILRGSSVLALSSLKDTAIFSTNYYPDNGTPEGLIHNEDLRVKIRFCNVTSGFTESNVAFKLTELPDYDIRIVMLVQTSTEIQVGGGLSLTNPGFSRSEMNPVVGNVNVGSPSSYNASGDIKIYARLYSQFGSVDGSWSLVDEILMYENATYIANTNIGTMSAFLQAHDQENPNPIPAAGYKVSIDCEETS